MPAVLVQADTLRDAALRSQIDAEHIMSMPASRRHRWTRAEVETLIATRTGYSPRYELVDGELLVTPAPSQKHQQIILELAVALRIYTAAQQIGELVISPCELRLNPEDYYEPDLFVMPAVNGHLPPSRPAAEWALLACEVLSPSSSRHDRITKRRAYQALGVPDYWVVDADAEAIEVWHPADERAALVDERLTWTPTGASTPFTLDVRAFFASVADGAPLG